MKNLRLKKSIIAFSGLIMSLWLLVPITAQAQSDSFKEQSGLDISANVAGYETGAGASTFEGIISNIILVIISFVGVVFLALLIYGGFTWMTAQGNQEAVAKASKIIKSAIIGLVITLSAYAISYFLISYFQP